MKLVNVQIIKDELERLIRDYRFHSSSEAKYRCEAYKELSEWLDNLDVKDDMDTIHPIEDVVSNDPIANSYKEKYEQALEVAKETYDKQPMYREWLEKMFPELKESEDEKIRKDIKRAISVTLDYSYFDKETADNCLSWLEKQGEQKPNPCDGCINRKGCINCENGELREAEQKPEENKGNLGGISSNSAWSEEEERYICQLESMVKERWALAEKAQDEEVIKNMSNLAFFLKTLNPNKKPTDEDMKILLRSEYEKGRADAIAEMQKEWSEEDIIHLNNCISYMSRLDSSEMDWLKSLKDRVQPKQEWSEEDEKMLKNVMSSINHESVMEGLKSRGISYSIDSSEHLMKKLIDWLKSLRPQNRWKPSDEQMEALYTYIYNPQYFNSPDPRMELVESVYKDLKKLKEG